MDSKPWTKEEEMFVRKNKEKMTYVQIGKALGRSSKAVGNFARRKGMGLKETGFINRMPNTKDLEYNLRKYLKYKEIADNLKVGQKTELGTIKELYPHIGIVVKDGKRDCFNRMDLAGYKEFSFKWRG